MVINILQQFGATAHRVHGNGCSRESETDRGRTEVTGQVLFGYWTSPASQDRPSPDSTQDHPAQSAPVSPVISAADAVACRHESGKSGGREGQEWGKGGGGLPPPQEVEKDSETGLGGREIESSS